MGRKLRQSTNFINTIITLIMEVISTSETSVRFYETTRCNILDGCHVPSRRRENLKTHNSLVSMGLFMVDECVAAITMWWMTSGALGIADSRMTSATIPCCTRERLWSLTLSVHGAPANFLSHMSIYRVSVTHVAFIFKYGDIKKRDVALYSYRNRR